MNKKEKLNEFGLKFFDSDWFVITIIGMIIGFSVIGCYLTCT